MPSSDFITSCHMDTAPLCISELRSFHSVDMISIPARGAAVIRERVHGLHGLVVVFLPRGRPAHGMGFSSLVAHTTNVHTIRSRRHVVQQHFLGAATICSANQLFERGWQPPVTSIGWSVTF